MAKQAAGEDATRSKRSRRDVLAGAAGALGVVAAQSLLREQAALADTGAPVILGVHNEESNVTTIINTGVESVQDDPSGLLVGASGDGFAVVAVAGSSSAGAGVLASGGSVGVVADGGLDVGTGVVGVGGQEGGNGVEGSTQAKGVGVLGREHRGGIGVHGISEATVGRGVVAENPFGGVGLEVIGTAVFSRSGLATVPTGLRSVKVAPVSLTSDSIVLAVVQQAGSRAVRNVVPNPATSSFTITLTATADVDTKVGWFVVN